MARPRSNKDGLAEQDLLQQAGAIPWRRLDDGGLEVLTISSRRGYWLVPKGGLDDGKTPREMAGIEAYEEAGVLGEVDAEPIGEFEYEKAGGARCVVEMFGLEVREVLHEWPEDHFRSRSWATPDQAAEIVRWPEMGELIRHLAARLEA